MTMLVVFLRDLLGLRRLISCALVIAVAILVADAVDLVISPRVYLVAVVASAAVTTALVLNSYYRVDSLKEYVHLPGTVGGFLIQLTLSIWLLLLLENVAAAVAFGLVRHDLGIPVVALMAGYALIAAGGVLLAIARRHSWVGPLGAVVTAGSAAAAIVLDSPTALAVIGATALAMLAIALASSIRYALLADRPPRAGRSAAANYFLTVLGRQRVVLVNGLVLMAFAVVFTLASWDQGVTIPLAFTLAGVNGPLGTIISGDPDLRVQFAMLGRPRRLLLHYGLAVAAYYSGVNAVLVGCYLWLGARNLIGLGALAITCTLIQAVALPVLESRYPITTARTQRDVWRHPRKYLVPAVLLGIAALVPA